MDSGLFVGQDFIPFETEKVLTVDGRKKLIKIPFSNLNFYYKNDTYLKDWKIKHVLYSNAEPLKTFSINQLKIKIKEIIGTRFDPRIHIRSLCKKDDTYTFDYGRGDKYILFLFNHEEFTKIDSLGKWYDIFKCINSTISRSSRDYYLKSSRSPERSHRRERSRSPKRSHRRERSRSPKRSHRRERSRSPPRVTKREEILDHQTKAEIDSEIMKKIMIERYRLEAEERIRKEMFFSTQYPYPPPPKPTFYDGHYPH